VWLLCGLAVVAAACGGCREWKSYVRLTPPSAEWTHDEQDLPEEYVWRTDGATVRAWSVGDARPFRCSGDSPDTPRNVTLTVVVTNHGPGPLEVSVACGAGDAGCVYDAYIQTDRTPANRTWQDRPVPPFEGQSFTLEPPDPRSREHSRTFSLSCSPHKGEPAPDVRSLPLDLTLRRGGAETHCAAQFIASGSGRTCRWYTFPTDSLYCLGVVAAVLVVTGVIFI
jgi:hypothetical protein